MSLALAFMAWTYLALFQFDLRCLSGFRAPTHYQGVVLYKCTDESYMEDPLVQMYESNRNQVLEAEPCTGQRFNVMTSGPTIFRFKSGRIRITHGAYMSGTTDGVTTIYAQ